MTRMTPEEITAFIDEMAGGGPQHLVIEAAGDKAARVRMKFSTDVLRPGGIVSGPSLMTLADYVVWVAVLAEVGPEPMTVTVSLNIHFLKPGMQRDVVAEARLHKVGKRLATGDVVMYSDGDSEPIAQASVTYSIPQRG
jgi:uncharacterized protein (TIGR00369 family)